MGWKGRGRGMWPGRGPFSYLPPWQRPGWIYGRGACWWLSRPYLQTATSTVPESTATPPTIPATPFMPPLTKEQETEMLEQQMKFLQSQLDAIRKRLEDLSS